MSCTLIVYGANVYDFLMIRTPAAELQALATVIVGLSSRPEDAHELLHVLGQHTVLISSRPLELLNHFDYKEQTIGTLFVLWQWKNNHEQGTPQWMSCAVRFLKECDRNALTVARGKFLSLARGVKKRALFLHKPHLAIAPLLNAVQKFSPSPDHLTPLHADLFQVCLLARNYNAARDVLFQNVYEMDPTVTLLTSTDFLLYCYYGGRLCIGLQQFERGLELLYLALVAPTMASNAIALMIYKLYHLVSLLKTGSVRELPRYTSGSVQRLNRMPSMTPYIRLSEAYEKSDPEEVKKVVAEAQEQFNDDGCTGLIDQVVRSLPKRDIKGSTRCYLTQSLSSIASSAGLSGEAEAEQLIAQLITDNHIAARISTRKGMVTFLDEEDIYDGQEGTEKLTTMIEDVIALGNRMNDVKDAIELDPEYRTKVLQSKQHSKLDC